MSMAPPPRSSSSRRRSSVPVAATAPVVSAPASPFARHAWLVPFGFLLLTIVAVPLRILEDEGLPRYRALRAELREVRAANERLAASVTALEAEIGALRTDPAAVERIARDELGLLRPDEEILQFDR